MGKIYLNQVKHRDQMSPHASGAASLKDLFMTEALNQAKIAYSLDEVPIGAVVVMNNEIIGRGHNSVISSQSVMAHAETNAIQDASNMMQNYRLTNCDLYVTVEPCHMCCMAMVHARIKNVFFGLLQPKMGAVISTDSFFKRKSLNHQVSFNHGCEFPEAKTLLENFFQARR